MMTNKSIFLFILGEIKSLKNLPDNIFVNMIILFKIWVKLSSFNVVTSFK